METFKMVVLLAAQLPCMIYGYNFNSTYLFFTSTRWYALSRVYISCNSLYTLEVNVEHDIGAKCLLTTIWHSRRLHILYPHTRALQMCVSSHQPHLQPVLQSNAHSRPSIILSSYSQQETCTFCCCKDLAPLNRSHNFRRHNPQFRPALLITCVWALIFSG